MTSLKHKIKTALDESRMLILGSQVLIGFHYRAAFEPSFQKLPVASQTIKLVALAIMLLVSALLMSPGPYHRIVHKGEDREDMVFLLALSMVFLMSPAAFHRIVEDGEDTERVHNFSGAMLLAAMVLLPLGISGDFFVVVRKVTEADGPAIAGSTAILIFFYGFWFGYTIYRKRKLHDSGAPG
jgi:uncharacterized protein DUF6328